MMRSLGLLLLGLLLALPAQAQVQLAPGGKCGTGALTTTTPFYQTVDSTGNTCVNTSTVGAPPNDVAAGPSSFTGAGTLAVNSQGSGAVGVVVTGSFSGAAWTMQGSVDGTNWATAPFFDNTAGGNTYTAQPSATATGTYIVPAAGFKQVRINVTAVTGTLTASLNASAGSAQRPVGVQGDNSNINGVNGQPIGDPCFLQAKSTAAIGTSGATNVQAVAGVSLKKVYLCSISIIAGAAAHFNIIEGTGGSCTTANEAAIYGSTTAGNGMSLAANGGFTVGSGTGVVGVTATAANGICILTDSSVQFGGNITYVQQ